MRSTAFVVRGSSFVAAKGPDSSLHPVAGGRKNAGNGVSPCSADPVLGSAVLRLVSAGDPNNPGKAADLKPRSALPITGKTAGSKGEPCATPFAICRLPLAF